MREICAKRVRRTLRVGQNRRTDELICQKQNGLEAEFAVAEVEEIFERRAEKVKDHGVVVTFSAEPPDEGHADATRECLVDLGFVFKLRVLGLDRLELDGDLLARDDVDPEIDVT